MFLKLLSHVISVCRAICVRRTITVCHAVSVDHIVSVYQAISVDHDLSACLAVNFISLSVLTTPSVLLALAVFDQTTPSHSTSIIYINERYIQYIINQIPPLLSAGASDIGNAAPLEASESAATMQSLLLQLLPCILAHFRPANQDRNEREPPLSTPAECESF